MTDEEREFIANNPRIIVGGEMDWAPMDFAVDGKHTGAAADYLREISSITGIEFEVIVGFTWSELLAMLRSRQVDMLPMVYWTEDRGREFNLTNPYITVRHYVFTKGRQPELKSFQNLYGKTMAIPTDYAYVEYFQKNHPEIKILEVDTMIDALDAVLIGTADAVIENTASVAHHTQQQNILGLEPAFPVKFEVNNVHMAIRSDEPILRDIVQKALDDISTETSTQILQKWTGSEAAARTFLTTQAEFTPAEQAYLRRSQSITVCAAANRMPIEAVRNNRYEGMTSDYLAILGDTFKVTIGQRATPTWRDAREQLVAGECDVVTLAVKNDFDANMISFSQPYILERLALATAPDERFYEDLNELSGVKIGVVNGYVDIEKLRTTFPDIELVAFATVDEALAQVADENMFGVLDYVPTLSHAIRSGYERSVKISGDFDDVSAGFSMAVRAEDPQLVSAIDKVLTAMPDAQRQNIHSKWVAVSIEKQTDYRILIQVLIGTGVLLIFFIFRLGEVRKHEREIEVKNQQLRSANSKLELQADSAMHMAHHDQLTGLPNRAKLLEDLDHSIKLSNRTGSKLAVLFLDLDRFKYVNDSLGHDVGDQLLKLVAERINELLRETDTLCRLGGDEFVVLLEAISDSYSPSIVAQRIVGALEMPFQIDEHTVNIGTSIGIAVCPDDTDELNSLVKYADSAMYAAKEGGRNGYRYYHDDLSLQASRRVIMETALRHSLRNDDFTLAIQPIIDLSSNTVIGGEALIRWEHPELGRVSPDEFIPIAEEVGLIVDIGEFVLRKTCEAIQMLDASNCKVATLSINTSTVEFLKGDISLRFSNILRDYDVSANRINIEITERYMLEHDPIAVAELKELRQMGHKISVDDFGTGYSSLSYMKRLPLNVIKIDRSFIQSIPFDQNDVAISQAIISLSHALDYEVVAEGVETPEQLDFLLKNNCNFAQGYFFSPPVPVEQFPAVVDEINSRQKADLGWTQKLRILRS
ncbi:MAG: EAL domain-containing protein [Pseudomonadota bacterium]